MEIFNQKTIRMLRLGAVMNFLLTAGHFAAIFFLDAAFRFYKIDGIMNNIASIWSPLPYLITIVLVGCFGMAWLYTLSATGDFHKLPFEKAVIIAIFAVFALRATTGIFILFIDFQMRGLVSIIIAAGIAICYLPAIKTYIKEFLENSGYQINH